MKGFHPSLFAIGGFVVGAAALRILLEGDKAKPVKRDIQTLPVTDPISIIANGTEVEGGAGVDHDALYEGAYDDESSNISSKKSLREQPRLPTDEEQGQDLALTGTAVSRRTNLFSPNNEDEADNALAQTRRDSSFRLKLYWKNGYYWQESRKETFWCMSCGYGGVCKEGEVMRLRNCKTRSSADARFEMIKKRRGYQYRVVGPNNLCLENSKKEISGKNIDIVLKTCNNNHKQQFKGYHRGATKFELKPSRKQGRCLTNHHHPRPGEEVYAETCFKARKTKTGYWVKY